MWTLRLQLVVFCVLLQVSGCFPSCLIVGSVASCDSRNLRRVPALPPNITHLYLEHNRISEIDSSSLRGLEQLQELDLGQQFVRLSIRSEAFSGLRHLRRLVLGYNTHLQLEPLAFAGLSSLQHLYLDFCSLSESILTENYLEPLTSLQTLDLFGNKIKVLQPSLFFANMTNLTHLNLKLNPIDRICESDLAGLQGKNFSFLNLDSLHLKEMSSRRFNWKKCGNPFRGMSFHTLYLSNNGFKTSVAKQFLKAIEGTKISHLKLSNYMGKGFSFHNENDPDRSTFEGLSNSSVHTLDLSQNKIFALQEGVFSTLKEVAVIDISQNNVNQIHRNAFEGLEEHLKMLNLSHNLLGEVHSYTFDSLTNLRVLDLSYNHIGILGYHSFRGLSSLKVLSLTGNSLREIGSPYLLDSLDYLLLNDNKLTSTWGLTMFADNITHLDIRDNRIPNLGEIYSLVLLLDHLQHLHYGGNTIRFCSLSGRPSEIESNDLRVVDLHSSSLQAVWSEGRCMNIFNNLRHVRSLNLSLNALQSLPQRIFKGLTSVVEMDLSSNSLTYLQPGVLPKSLQVLHLSNNFIASPDPAALSSLSSLDLKMNRFHCDSTLRSFLSWMEQTNVTFLSPVKELRCEFPAGFYQVSLLDFSDEVTQQ